MAAVKEVQFLRSHVNVFKTLKVIVDIYIQVINFLTPYYEGFALGLFNSVC